jgi:hypothetical protein
MSRCETSTTFCAGCAFHQAPTLIGCFVFKERAARSNRVATQPKQQRSGIMGPGKISVKLTRRGNALALLSQAPKPESAGLSEGPVSNATTRVGSAHTRGKSLFRNGECRRRCSSQFEIESRARRDPLARGCERGKEDAELKMCCPPTVTCDETARAASRRRPPCLLSDRWSQRVNETGAARRACLRSAALHRRD